MLDGARAGLLIELLEQSGTNAERITRHGSQVILSSYSHTMIRAGEP